MKYLLPLVFALLVFLPSSSNATKLPLESFAQLPDVSQMVLSPDGTKVAALTRVDIPGQKGVSVQITQLDNNESKVVLFTDNSTYVFYNLAWKDEKTLLAWGFAPLKQESWGHGQPSTYKTRVIRLLFVNTETGEVTKPFTKMFLSEYNIAPADQATVIDILHDDPKHILMDFNGDAYKVNIHSGVAKAYNKRRLSIHPTVTDRQHRLRAGFRIDGNKITAKFYDLKLEKWRKLATAEGIFSEDDIDLLGFSENPNELYISTYHNDYRAIFKVDLNDPELKRELVLSDETQDISGALVYSYKQKRLIGISANETSQTIFFDKEFDAIKQKVDNAIPNAKNYLFSFSDDLNKFLIYSTGPQESGTYYVGQVSPLKIDAVAYRYKALTPDLLSKVTRIEYKAKDGLNIEAFLTLPREFNEVAPTTQLPTIIFPHGGPIARDTDAFDYWAQYFSNKGFAVLQMNFRGSSGYGLTHRNAGLGKWGQEMQDDIDGGARHLIEKGIADPKRIAIVGASYGGYAALMGTVRSPNLYQCAISVAGVSDVYQLVLDERAFWRTYNVVDEQIGTGKNFLRDISPISHADKINVPILLIHGESDRQVDIEHSIKMRDKLLSAGKKVEFLVLPDEDHYLSIESNRINTFKSMDKFLDSCISAAPAN